MIIWFFKVKNEGIHIFIYPEIPQTSLAYGYKWECCTRKDPNFTHSQMLTQDSEYSRNSSDVLINMSTTTRCWHNPWALTRQPLDFAVFANQRPRGDGSCIDFSWSRGWRLPSGFCLVSPPPWSSSSLPSFVVMRCGRRKAVVLS